MGKYSEKVAFAGVPDRSRSRSRSEGDKEYPKIDWAAQIDERVDVVQAMIDYAGVQFASSRDTRKQLRAKCPYPGCSSKEDSLSVWPRRSSRTKYHYHCRKCDQAGDLIRLLEDINGWSFSEVLEHLGLLQGGTAQPRRQRVEGPEEKLERVRLERLAQQLQALRHAYETGRMQANLLKYERPGAYLLAGRGITLEQAATYGLGYIPAPKETGEPANSLLWAWQGRIIFPLTGRDGLTFAGRSLALWEPGMPPAQHKAAIDAYNERARASDKPGIIRYLKTSPCGHFGFDEAKAYNHWRLPEGEFDALSVRISGVSGVVAMGTGFDPSIIPASVERVTLGFDSDAPGKEAMRRIRRDLEMYGLEVDQVMPGSKDWNDLLIAGQVATIRDLFAAPAPAVDPEPEEIPATPDQLPTGDVSPEFIAAPDTCLDCGAHVSDESRSFFYWPIGGDQVVCFCTNCRIEDSGPTWITENSWPEPDYANLAFFDDGSEDEEPEQPSAPIKEPFRAETPALFLELAAIPRTYSKPFAAYGLVDGVVTQIGMHGRGSGQFWTMDEWAALPAPDPEENAPALVVAAPVDEDPIVKLKAEFQAYANRHEMLFWKSDMPGGYDNALVARKVYLKRLRACLESGNETMIGAAVHDMRVRIYGKDELRKWDFANVRSLF